jgi:hypothetical protein
MSVILRDGSVVEDPRLDRLVQVDWRSLNYPVSSHPRLAVAPKTPRSYTWACNVWLNQGAEGACVGAGFGHEAAGRPQEVAGVSMEWARTRVYWEAQRIDEWEGGAYPDAQPFYEGTSVLAGAKVMQRLGVYRGYTWGLDLEQTVVGIGRTGPAVLGVNWYEGMWDTDGDGFLHPTGRIVGGHCLVAIGVKVVYNGTGRTWADVNLDRSHALAHNSWGQHWGVNGRAKLTFRDLGRLLNEGGEALFPVRSAVREI